MLKILPKNLNQSKFNLVKKNNFFNNKTLKHFIYGAQTIFNSTNNNNAKNLITISKCKTNFIKKKNK